jgi:hypothetical protein
MNERFACWVIVAGDISTGFRSRDRDELVPTLKQLQRTQPDAALKYFARGKLWESDAAAAQALVEARRAKRTRTDAWRPGGRHVDPRARFEMTRDEKRARYKRRQFGKPSEGLARRPSRPAPPRKKR